MTDHPGWTVGSDGLAHRAFRTGATTCILTCDLVSTTVAPTIDPVRLIAAAEDIRPRIDLFDTRQLPWPFARTPSISAIGLRHRVRNSDLWDAMLPPLLKSRDHTRDGVRRYRNLCLEHGEQVTTPEGIPLPLSPTAETVVQLDDTAFAVAGVTVLASALRGAAETYLEHRDQWMRLPPDDLFQAIQATPRIGPWCAAITVADLTGDFSLAPHIDFGNYARWDQFAAELNDGTTAVGFAHTWDNLIRHQRSILAALSIDAKARTTMQPHAARTTRST